MDPFGVQAVSTAGIIGSVMAVRAVQRQSLTVAGALTGFAIAFAMVCTGLRGLVLLVVYQVGSWATKYRGSEKSHRDATLATHAQRGATQVLCVSLLACLLSLYHAAVCCGSEKPVDFQRYPTASHLATAVTAHHATALADTLASELGMLAHQQQPFLITQPWKRVPPGTNGGITFAGCGWSLAGGAVIGLGTVGLDHLSGLQPWPTYAVPLVGYATLTGLLGSLLDSLVGATLQATYWDADTKRIYHADHRPATAQHLHGLDCLTNEQVNFLSTALTVLIGGWILAPIILS